MKFLNFKKSLLLPQTKLPMRGSLHIKELELLKLWKNPSSRPSSISTIHDGPPFTNGNIHIGTALNKILKDVLNRHTSYKNVLLAPGWDCHGLPIENKALPFTEFKVIDSIKQQVKLRLLCSKISKKYIGLQQKQFKRLGLLVNWSCSYKTMDNRYEGRVIAIFNSLLLQKLVYFKNKPVYWSVPCKTALAEAEVEYSKKLSDSVHIKFKIRNLFLLKTGLDVFFIIWTTTPWTLVANQALCLRGGSDYFIIKVWGLKTVVVGSFKLIKTLLTGLRITRFKVVGFITLPNKGLNIYCKNPINSKTIPVVLDNYVDLDSGTGIIHIAPNHGFDDYKISLKNRIFSINKLTRHSTFNRIQLYLFDKKRTQNAFNKSLINFLILRGGVLFFEKIIHDYPYCWRSKTPLIFKSTKQWFVDMGYFLKKKAKTFLKGVVFNPPKSRNRLSNLVKNRPDWCISRQRAWGVPMPIFFNNKGTPLTDNTVLEHIKSLIILKGSNILYFKSASTLVSTLKVTSTFYLKSLSFCKETFDVWFVSGSSYLTLKNQKQLKYIEGNDQHRGWFQSSLWLGLLYNNNIPYGILNTHGFIINKDGVKFSKSSKSKKKELPYILKKYGVDLIRLWLCSENPYNDILFSEKIISSTVQSYRIFRNTFRFIVGNTLNLCVYKEKVQYSSLKKYDRFFLHKLNIHLRKQYLSKESLGIVNLVKELTTYCSTFLSVKFQNLKERLYTYPKKSISRVSSQSTLNTVVLYLISMLNPILLFTSLETLKVLKELNFNTPPKGTLHIKKYPQHHLSWYNPTISTLNIIYFQYIQKLIGKYTEVFIKKNFLMSNKTSHLPQLVLILGYSRGFYKNFSKLNNLFYKKNNETFNLSEVTRRFFIGKNRIFLNINRVGSFYCQRSWKNYKKLIWDLKLGFISKVSYKAVNG